MDFNHEEEAIAGLDLDRRKIKAVAELFSSTQSQLAIAKLIQRYFEKEEHPAYKTALFLLSCQLFLLAKANQNTQFFKHLSPKITIFLSQLNKLIIEQTHLVDLVVNALKKLEKEKVFADAFLKRLRLTAKDILQKYEEEEVVEIVMEQPKPKNKYGKEFLQNMKEIRSFDLTSSLYDHHAQKVKLQAQISSLHKQFEDLKSLKNGGNPEKKHSRDLLSQVDEYCKRLQELTTNFHSGLKSLADECEQPFSQVIAQQR